MLVETYYSGQEYVEDCEVCCGAILVGYQVEDGKVVSSLAKKLTNEKLI